MKALAMMLNMTVLLSLLAYSGCDKGVDPDKPIKNPREYTWTVDTLIAHPDAIQTQMWDIYATSPQNVYVVGHTDWTGVNGSGIMWRYDGTSWSIVNQGFRDISLESITGFGPSNVYAAGNKGPNALILGFDGVNWTQQVLPGRPLYSIRGTSPSDIWAGGWMGTAFHFDGSQWMNISLDNRTSIRDMATLGGATYATAYRTSEMFPADSIWWSFLKWNDSQWDTLDAYLDAGQNANRTFRGLLDVVDGKLFSSGGSVFRLTSDKWEEVFSGPNAGPVAGPSQDNMFSVGFAGTVYHYDGSDWFQFNQFQSEEFSFGSVWFDGREVFVVGNNGPLTIVLHGK